MNITQNDLTSIAGLPLLLNAENKEQGTSEWVNQHSQDIESLIRKNGALLVRGLNIVGSRQFGNVLSALFGSNLLPYNYRSTPRTGLRGNIYTATEYNSSELIPQHNENAYSNNWPMRIGFCCLLPSEKGGETPIADSRIIYQKMPASIRDKFAEKGIMYVRNFSNIDLPWSEVFNTDNPEEVEKYCNENAIEYQWLEHQNLRTRQVLPAITKHPDTGDLLWFNQAHLFHATAMGSEIYQTLLSSHGESHLPRNAYYGDGSKIEDEVIKIIQDIYQENKISFLWKKGDLLLLDNMLFSHGREPFFGERKVLVGMARACSVDKQNNSVVNIALS